MATYGIYPLVGNNGNVLSKYIGVPFPLIGFGRSIYRISYAYLIVNSLSDKICNFTNFLNTFRSANAKSSKYSRGVSSSCSKNIGTL